MKVLLDEIRGRLDRNERLILAIDGPCASGKTTLAAEIATKFDCNVIHLDDFFLQPDQRTDERLSEIGGNFDRERFAYEVLTPLREGIAFSYRPWDCSEGSLGAPIAVQPKRLTVIEGSYSHHPALEGIALRVFLEIDREQQVHRLLQRDPKKITRFLEEWIPKEDAYFRAFQIREKADLVLTVKQGRS